LAEVLAMDARAIDIDEMLLCRHRFATCLQVKQDYAGPRNGGDDLGGEDRQGCAN